MVEEDFGSLDGGLQDPEIQQETRPPGAPQSAPVKTQPCNQATMMCLRGPCVHLWRLVLRFDSAVKDVMREHNATCLASKSEEFDLNDRLIYFCDRWWPRAPLCDDDGKTVVKAPLLSEEDRARDRAALHAAWEDGLRQMGYDFAWRDFEPEANADDAPHQRKFNAPGGLEAAREALQDAALPPAGSIPEDDA